MGLEGFTEVMDAARLEGRDGSNMLTELDPGGPSGFAVGGAVFPVVACLTSNTPPPLVTSIFSAVFFRQKDHFGRASTTTGADSTGTSGSPSLERLVQESRDAAASSRLARRDEVVDVSREVSGAGLGRDKAYACLSCVVVEEIKIGYVL